MAPKPDADPQAPGPARPAGGTPGTMPAATLPRGAEEEPAALAHPLVLPITQRIPFFLRHPLQLSCLAWLLAPALGVFALCAWVMPAVGDRGPPTTLLVLVTWALAGIVVARFASLVTERTSTGFLAAHSWPRELGGAGPVRAANTFVATVFLPVALAWLLGKVLPFVLAAVLAAVAVPAVLAALTQTGSLPAAFAPRRAIDLVRRIGAPYALLCVAPVAGVYLWRAFFLACYPAGLPAPDGPPAASPLGQAALAAFLALLSGYTLLLLAVTTGYAMFRESDFLGIAVLGPGEAREDRALASARYARRSREALVTRLLAEGEVREAIGIVENELRERPRDLALHRRLRELLAHEGSRIRLDAHGERYLALLIAAGRGADAVALLREMRAAPGGYEPKEAAQRIALARAALDCGAQELVAELLQAFDKRYPRDPAIPEAYLLGGRLLLLRGQPEQAKALLGHVARTASPGPVLEEARRYLARFP